MFPSLSSTPTFNDIFKMLRQKHMGTSGTPSSDSNQPVKPSPSSNLPKPFGESNSSTTNINNALFQQLQSQRTLDLLNKSLNPEGQPNKPVNIQTLLSALQNKLKEKTLSELGLAGSGNELQQILAAQKQLNLQDGGNKTADKETPGSRDQNVVPNMQFLDTENDPSYASLLEARSKKIKKMNTCGHPERSHYAKNMCNQCYHKFGRTKKPWKCNHDRLYAHGLCQNCYINAYNKKRSQKLKDPNDVTNNSSPRSASLGLEGPVGSDTNNEPLLVEDKLASQDVPSKEDTETETPKDV